MKLTTTSLLILTAATLASCATIAPEPAPTNDAGAYFVANYTVTNQEQYSEYLAQAGSTVEMFGGEIVTVDFTSEAAEGDPGPVTVVLRFDDTAALKGWYNSPEYQAIINLRLDNTNGSATFTKSAPE